MRKFSGKWYTGTVDELEVDESTKLWHITYEDFDGEDLTRQELAAALLYHPLLNTMGDLQVSSVDSFVWYSQEGRPRLGKVLEIDSTVSRPLTIHVFEPMRNNGGLHLAKFRPCMDKDSQGPVVARITLHQVLIQLSGLTKLGYLPQADRLRLQKQLRL